MFQIAVIDDEPSITKLLKLGFEDHFNCEVMTFNSSNEGFKKLLTHKFDLVVLDHRMPELTGMEIVRQLRSSNSMNASVKILLLTGHLEEAESFDPTILDQVVFLQKPVTESRILRWASFMLSVAQNKPA